VERRALGDSGIHDQHLDRAVDRPRFLERVGDLARLGDVARHGIAAEALCGLLQRLHPPPEQGDFRAGRVKVRCSRGADAGATAGD
jgi:hypothetical protein